MKLCFTDAYSGFEDVFEERCNIFIVVADPSGEIVMN